MILNKIVVNNSNVQPSDILNNNFISGNAVMSMFDDNTVENKNCKDGKFLGAYVEQIGETEEIHYDIIIETENQYSTSYAICEFYNISNNLTILLNTYYTAGSPSVGDYWIFNENGTVLYGNYPEDHSTLKLREYSIDLREYPNNLTIKMNVYYYQNPTIVNLMFNQSSGWAKCSNNANILLNKTIDDNIKNSQYNPFIANNVVQELTTAFYAIKDEEYVEYPKSDRTYIINKMKEVSNDLIVTIHTYMGGSSDVPDYGIFDSEYNIIYAHTFSEQYSDELREYTVDLRQYPSNLIIATNIYQLDLHPLYYDILTNMHSSWNSSNPELNLKNSVLNEIQHKLIDPIDISSKEISIFFVGCSLTISAVQFLPLMLKRCNPNVNFRIYLWYNAGSTMKMQYEQRFTQNRNCEIFAVCENSSTGTWTTYNNDSRFTMDYILQNYQFDILCFEEYSYYSFTDEQELTNYNNFMNYILDRYTKNSLQTVFLLDEPDRSKIDDMHTLASHYATLLLENTITNDVVAPGTAIYLGLKDTELNALGDRGALSPDGTHALDGHPRMMEALAIVQWIFQNYGIPVTSECDFTLTQSIYSQINWQANVGSGVLIFNSSQIKKAKVIAHQAYKYSRKLYEIATNNIISS